MLGRNNGGIIWELYHCTGRLAIDSGLAKRELTGAANQWFPFVEINHNAVSQSYQRGNHDSNEREPFRPRPSDRPKFLAVPI
jgi:hypothetical protein